MVYVMIYKLFPEITPLNGVIWTYGSGDDLCSKFPVDPDLDVNNYSFENKVETIIGMIHMNYDGF